MTYVALLGIATLVSAGSAATQSTNDAAKIAAVNAVLEYRVVWMEDLTPFDACEVYVAMGRPLDFPGVLTRQARRVVQPEGDPCSVAPSGTARRPSRLVRVDSVVLGDTLGIVRLAVQKGEKRILETYRLRPRTGGSAWGVRDVTLWGALRVYFSSPAPAVPSSQTPK
jgi:hypothetical protein